VTPPNKSLDASGDSVFRIMTGPAMLEWIRAAASTPPFDALFEITVVRLTHVTIVCIFLVVAGLDTHAQRTKDARSNALLRAASANEVDAAQKLLNEGAKVNAPNQHGETALMLGAHHPEMVAALLKAGAHVNAQNKGGATPLMYSMLDDRDGARLLIAAGADVNAKTKTGMTALMMAAHDGRVDKIRMLVQAGADVNATDKLRKSALTYAREKSKPMP
jgi:ankyrin repeat protein